MVSKNPNPPEGFYLDSPGMALPGLSPFASVTTAAATTTSASAANSSDDPSKKIRKPYTITKSRESWSEPEHDKFFEALQLFDRDWKKIEAFVGSKTVIQFFLGGFCFAVGGVLNELYANEKDKLRLNELYANEKEKFRQFVKYFVFHSKIRSHAQKYFQKVQKSGGNEHLPPPRPKRKAAHPYPQKASKYALVHSQIPVSFQSSSPLVEPGYIIQPDSSAMIKTPATNAAVSSRSNNTLQTTNLLHGPRMNNSCSSSESTRRARPIGVSTGQGNNSHPLRVLPDFAQVYKFIGSVFDPKASGQLQKLKRMDPIDVETVLLLMRNLSINLASPDFEDHRRLLSSYEVEPGTI